MADKGNGKNKRSVQDELYEEMRSKPDYEQKMKRAKARGYYHDDDASALDRMAYDDKRNTDRTLAERGIADPDKMGGAIRRSGRGMQGMACGGKVKAHKKGGMVRGSGKAVKGVKPCKMR